MNCSGGWSSIQECGCYIPIRRIWWRNTPTITIPSFDHGTHHDVRKKLTSSSALNLGGKSLPRPLIFSPGADGKLLARPAFSARWPEGERQNYTTHTEIAWVKNPSRDIHILHSICFSFSFSFSLSLSLCLSLYASPSPRLLWVYSAYIDLQSTVICMGIMLALYFWSYIKFLLVYCVSYITLLYIPMLVIHVPLVLGPWPKRCQVSCRSKLFLISWSYLGGWCHWCHQQKDAKGKDSKCTKVTYCGWKKSCATLHGRNPRNNEINHVSTGEGVIPSTVWYGLIWRYYIIKTNVIVRENKGFQSKNAGRNLETTTKNKINMLNQHNIQIDTSTKKQRICGGQQRY